MLHGNPIRSLPMTLNKIWNGLQEFSLDWLMYLLPYIGRIIKVKEQDAELSKIEVKKLDMRRNISASRIRVNEESKSFGPGGQPRSQKEKSY
jgi:hypothetical protein